MADKKDTDPFSTTETTEKKYDVDIPGPRAGKGEMDDEELKGIMHQLVHAAKNFIDDEVSPDRAKATAYYKGEKFGNEQEGRSQVILTEVRDGIASALPSLLRVLVGAQDPVEFMPRRVDAVEQAKQATDYVKYVFTVDNPGFMLTLDMLKDGMTKKLGIWKWFWEESEPKPGEAENVSEEQLVALSQQPGVEIISAEQKAQPDGSNLYDVKFTVRDQNGRARILGIPPEEFIFLRDTRKVGSGAIFVAHRTEKTRGALIALGVDEKIIDEHGGSDPSLELNDEQFARNPNSQMVDDPKTTESNDKILYVEGYAEIDVDGDGISELRKICTIGTGCYVVMNEPADERPFAVFSPDPEPHTLLGGSWAERLMDLQLTNSSILRATLDSMAAAIFPRTWYKEGDANAVDVLNTAIGAPIRTRTGGLAVGTFAHPFLGKEALLVLDYMRQVQERRTGRNDSIGGLDADALQSTTREGTAAAIDASQAQIELIAKIFAETTMKPLFRGILRLLAKHQPAERMVRLRGKWIPVDPKAWDTDMDLAVNVALGSGLVEKKLALYDRISAEQKEIIAQLGPSNPMVTLGMYRNTLAKALELSGEDPSQFFREIPLDWQPPPPPAPPEDPAVMLAKAQIQTDQMKAQAQVQQKQAELELKRMELMMADDRERDKNAADIQLRIREMELKYAGMVDQAQLDAAIERERMTTQAGLDAHATRTQAAVDQHATETQAAVDRHATEREAQVAENTAAAGTAA